MMVALALCTTGLGVLIPVFRDGGQLETPFGRLFLAAGTLGEVGPDRRHVAAAVAALQHVAGGRVPGRVSRRSSSLPQPSAWARDRRGCWHCSAARCTSSTQLPVRLSLLRAGGDCSCWPRSSVSRASSARFAAGMVVGLATRGEREAAARQDRCGRVRLVLSVLFRGHRHQVRHRGVGRRPHDDAPGADIPDPVPGGPRGAGLALSQ